MSFAAEALADRQQCCTVQDTLNTRTNPAYPLVNLSYDSCLSYALLATLNPELNIGAGNSDQLDSAAHPIHLCF